MTTPSFSPGIPRADRAGGRKACPPHAASGACSRLQVGKNPPGAARARCEVGVKDRSGATQRDPRKAELAILLNLRKPRPMWSAERVLDSLGPREGLLNWQSSPHVMWLGAVMAAERVA